MLSDCEGIVQNKLKCDKITVHFCGKDEKHDAASYSFLPILIHSCPTNFSTVNYFEVRRIFCVFRFFEFRSYFRL